MPTDAIHLMPVAKAARFLKYDRGLCVCASKAHLCVDNSTPVNWPQNACTSASCLTSILAYAYQTTQNRRSCVKVQQTDLSSVLMSEAHLAASQEESSGQV